MLGLVLAAILSVVDFLTEGLFLKITQGKMKFVSFAAGVSISYVFLVLLPEIYLDANQINRLLFLSLLSGFVVFHLLEKYIRQRYHGSQLRAEHYIIHSTVSFVYFFVVGYTLVTVADFMKTSAVLLFVPVVLHIIIDSLPRRATHQLGVRLFSAISPVLGALFAMFVPLGSLADIMMMGIIGGGLLYQIVRESLPVEREGKPMFFIVGLLLFTVFILLLWNLGF